jgi:hypothetical protein
MELRVGRSYPMLTFATRLPQREQFGNVYDPRILASLLSTTDCGYNGGLIKAVR